MLTGSVLPEQDGGTKTDPNQQSQQEEQRPGQQQADNGCGQIKKTFGVHL
jgi:hypothetical protein